MSDFETEDTEETVTCLRIIIYHPKQEESPVFHALKFCHNQQLRADDVVKFGRDSNICRFPFIDARVSRVQFGLQFFRHFNSSEFGFEIKNLSKKAKLIVDNIELGYLNKVSLPDKCMVCFGEYQMLLQKQEGQSEDYFNICFELARKSLLQEKNLFLKKPVCESSSSYTQFPTEMDENE
ncbi:TRAF-interacting protein with FHA domain-containing protein A [Python bivittatus]|uniref:TRAF-interacting protein with FHA domain-containing protein A n=1 Tax=Python bivittatus TaxID=176946 RepID=A0A9F5IXL7_PYTBI|nr:TRAF-interacting protein with FHA domain-containing protein A [Python bivittatus]XP_007437809.1 TRAF-interacting protein with FHA domain-containing protein A [Python bivittatus]XP_025028651.1 TRAF-interacting protein with FHA domain-containing protein A [Python bivittatus]XP_025028652.1 TRAF-interacting protein with FHA domain-containing protein A [Python bivittatus]XP_025028653.1 TRAF-interacting protein with FHA domain-containing protein A [Python bivittatus]